jgi:hypothetical protein
MGLLMGLLIGPLLSLQVGSFWAKYTADMEHRHVLLAYGFCWAIQLAYLAFVLVKARSRSQQ